MTISPMTNQTALRVAELERACFSEPWSADAFISELLNPLAVYLVAEDGGEVTGYAGMHRVLDEAYVTNVAVSPSHRRKGVARALMRGLIERCQKENAAFITLEVRASNSAAFSLYRGMGFERVGRRAGYYSNPAEDAVLMTKTLTERKRDEDTGD